MKLILTAIALCISTSVMAQQVDPNDITDSEVSAFKEYLVSQINQKTGSNLKSSDMKEKDAAAILKKTYELRTNVPQLHQDYKGRIGGTEVDETASGGPVLIIWMKKPSADDRQKLESVVNSKNISLRETNYSTEEIDKIRDLIFKNLIASDVSIAEYDHDRQAFILYSNSGNTKNINAAFKKPGLEKVNFKVQVVPPAEPTKPTLRGSIPIGGSNYLGCSLGFNVTGGGWPFMITAGHCAAKGAGIYQYMAGRNSPVFMGTTTDSIYKAGDKTDFAIIGNDYWANNQVGESVDKGTTSFFPKYTGVYFDWERTAYAKVKGAYTIPSTDRPHVCRRGWVSGTTCGKITSLNARADYPPGVITGLIAINVCASGGDSGGPVTYNSYAIGIVSSSNWVCTKSTPEPHYITNAVPIQHILSHYGVSLITSQ